MLKRLSLFFFLFFFLFSFQALADQSTTVTSQLNVSWDGPPLPNLYQNTQAGVYIGGNYQDASSDKACLATPADLSDATTDTASLICANTGNIKIAGWVQLVVDIVYTIGSGSTVWTQCDKSLDDGQHWGPIYYENPDGSKHIRQEFWNTTSNGLVSHSIPLVADLARCRAWITGGDSSSTVFFIVRVAGDKS